MPATGHDAHELPIYEPVSADLRLEQTRRAISKAATHTFRSHGYTATTMGAVAVLAGVSPRTLYRHYGSKSDLFAATISANTKGFLEQLSASVEKSPLRASILSAFTSTIIDTSEEDRALLHLAMTDERVLRSYLVSTQRMVRPLALTLRSKADGSDDDDLLVWDVRAWALLSALNVAYRRWAETHDTDLMEVVTSALDAVLPILEPATTGVSHPE